MIARFFCLLAVACGSASAILSRAQTVEYLSEPIDESIRETYRDLLKAKLLTSGGDYGVITVMPTGLGEWAVSASAVRQEENKAPEFRLIFTSAATNLYDSQIATDPKESDIPVREISVKIDKRFALRVQRAWRAILSKEPPSQSEDVATMVLDGYTADFSVAMPDGKVLTRRTVSPQAPPASELVNLGYELRDYCLLPIEQRKRKRAEIIEELEKFSDRVEKQNHRSADSAKKRNENSAGATIPNIGSLALISNATERSPRVRKKSTSAAVVSNAPKRPPNNLTLGNPPPQYQIAIKDNSAEMRFDLTLISSDDRPLCVSGGGWPNEFGHVDWGSSWVKLRSKSRIFPARDWDLGYCDGKDCSHRVGPKGTLTGFIGYAEFGDPKEISALPDRRLLFQTSAYVCPHEQAQGSDFSSSTSPQTLALVSSAPESLPADNTTIVQLLSDGPAPLQRKIEDLPACVLRGLRRWYEKPFAFVEQGQDFPKLRDIRRAGDGQFRLLFFSELKDASSVLCFEDHTSLGLTRRAVIFRRSGAECSVAMDFAFDLPLNSLEDLRAAITLQSSGK